MDIVESQTHMVNMCKVPPRTRHALHKLKPSTARIRDAWGRTWQTMCIGVHWSRSLVGRHRRLKHSCKTSGIVPGVGRLGAGITQILLCAVSP